MRTSIVLLALLITSALAIPTAGETAAPPFYTRFGLTITLPAGWYALRHKLTPCIDPAERLTVAGRGGLVMLQERLHPVRAELPARPKHFLLRGRPQYMECCAPRARRGWSLRFREKGRGFYAYVYLGEPGTRTEALAILASLRVEPRSSERG